MAEQSGDIVEIGQWVLEHACFDRRGGSKDGRRDIGDGRQRVGASAHGTWVPCSP